MFQMSDNLDLYFPVFNTRGRTQSSAEPEPLSQFANLTPGAVLSIIRIAFRLFFIGPESDHVYPCHSLTDSLTNSLTAV